MSRAHVGAEESLRPKGGTGCIPGGPGGRRGSTARCPLPIIQGTVIRWRS